MEEDKASKGVLAKVHKYTEFKFTSISRGVCTKIIARATYGHHFDVEHIYGRI